MSGERTKNVEEVRLPSLATANLLRERIPDALAHQDDRRMKTVRWSLDAPGSVQRTVERVSSRAERAARRRGDKAESPGQPPLTPGEKRWIDFSRTNIFHARSCKGLAISYGVDDWLAYYDHTLTVGEHRDIYRRAGADEMAMRDLKGRLHQAARATD